MKKITKEAYIKRIDEIENILFKELKLRTVLNDEELNEFFTSMIAYLEHSSDKEKIAGRTPETLRRNIKTFINFCKKIELSDKDILKVLIKSTSILHGCNELEDKYILLGLVENEDNTLRKTKLLKKPEDYRMSLDVLYSRYSLASSLDYKYTWNTLINNSEYEFATIFTKVGYAKPYKIFSKVEDCSREKLIKMYPVDKNFINELRELEINSCFKEKSKINGK